MVLVGGAGCLTTGNVGTRSTEHTSSVGRARHAPSRPFLHRQIIELARACRSGPFIPHPKACAKRACSDRTPLAPCHDKGRSLSEPVAVRFTDTKPYYRSYQSRERRRWPLGLGDATSRAGPPRTDAYSASSSTALGELPIHRLVAVCESMPRARAIALTHPALRRRFSRFRRYSPATRCSP